jgi:prepilin-type N-terminal cleavage/methylation domain-containing protein
MATGNPRRRERGFSLIELMIALVATLIISGAVVQLVGAGKGAFRREPEISDRQQNIRMAMAMIQQDVQAAGLGLPAFAQAFTDGLNNLGPQVPTAASGTKTDELEILTLTACPILTICKATGTNVDTWEELPQCYGFPTLVALWNSTETGIFWGDAPGNGGGTQSCNASGGNTGTGTGGGNSGGSGGKGNGNNNSGSGGTGGGNSGGGSGNTGDKNGHVVMPHGQDRFHNPPGGPGFVPTSLGIISVIRYRVVMDADGVPNLWRSAYGGSNINGQSSWQMVARGIEDLQVQYRNVGVAWLDAPGNVSCLANCAAPGTTEYNRIIRQVRVVLSARSTAANLQGATTAQQGPTAIRGRLQQEIAPRAALTALTSATGTNKWY